MRILWDIGFGRKAALRGSRRKGPADCAGTPVVENAGRGPAARWSELAAHDRLVVGSHRVRPSHGPAQRRFPGAGGIAFWSSTIRSHIVRQQDDNKGRRCCDYRSAGHARCCCRPVTCTACCAAPRSAATSSRVPHQSPSASRPSEPPSNRSEPSSSRRVSVPEGRKASPPSSSSPPTKSGRYSRRSPVPRPVRWRDGARAAGTLERRRLSPPIPAV